MKDMIPKGTGNSRFLRSVSNFKDIYPTYDDFVNALVAGNLPVDFNGINEAGVQQVGTALNKANLLTDEVARQVGLRTADPTPNDMFNVLANIGNVHVWQRVQTYADPVPEVPAGYTLGAVEENVLIAKVENSMVNESNGKMVVVYSENVDVSNDGDVSMPSDASSIDGFLTAVPNNFSSPGDKYLRYENSKYGSIIFNVSDIVYLPADSVYSVTEDDLYNYLYVSKLQRVTGYPYTPAIPAGTHVDYLTSTDPNAYPKQSAEGGQDAYYTLGDVEVGSFNLSSENNTAANITFYKSASVSVADDGTLSLVSPTDQRFQGSQYLSNADAFLTNAKGGYIMTDSSECGFLAGEVYFIPSDAEGSYNSPGWYLTKRQKVTGYPAIPADTVITYLGQLGESGAKIEVVSYVGTGTYGADNPVTIKFDITPKILFISCAQSDDDANVASGNGGWVRTSSFSGTTARPGSVTFDGKNVSLYAPSKNSSYDARSSYNYSGWEYTAIAIS